MGEVEAARAIEPLCMLWCIPGFLRNDWSHAFKLLKQPEENPWPLPVDRRARCSAAFYGRPPTGEAL